MPGLIPTNPAEAVDLPSVAGKPALINSVFGVALALVGTPVYFFYRGRTNQGIKTTR